MRDVEKIKNLSARIPQELWVFLKKYSLEKEESMTEIVIKALYKIMRSEEKKKM